MNDRVELKKPVAEVYVAALNELGYSASIDDEGDVEFKSDGVDLKFCAVIDEDHHKFVSISCLFFYKLSSKDEKTNVYIACNIANLETKVAKTYLNRSGRSVSTSYECFVDELTKENIMAAVRSGVVTTTAAMKNFVEALQSNS
ncbi:YbjN domain-containing protein [Pseudomonas botevensis]|uniref:YbjN domain-containing protein n=1 Tax=Pseudomonas botevensis TaxID=2842352 RepID=UPI001C3CD7AC|nr:YbjN domain-containing protein [Pseudomonas botevensis]MBV4475375.1 YbjN domain-containing protein [Pseudomonas botevensis]